MQLPERDSSSPGDREQKGGLGLGGNPESGLSSSPSRFFPFRLSSIACKCRCPTISGTPETVGRRRTPQTELCLPKRSEPLRAAASARNNPELYCTIPAKRDADGEMRRDETPKWQFGFSPRTLPALSSPLFRMIFPAMIVKMRLSKRT